MEIPVSGIHEHLSQWLDTIGDEALTITRRGKPVAVIVSPEEYAHLSRVKAYLDVLRLSRILSHGRVSASELFDSSRDELEQRV